jgi:hypothetical protein
LAALHGSGKLGAVAARIEQGDSDLMGWTALRETMAQLPARVVGMEACRVRSTGRGSCAIVSRSLLRLTRFCTTTWPRASTPWSWNTCFATSIPSVVQCIVDPPSLYCNGVSILAHDEAVM